ncbi:MAG TPA: metalloregulator ArsR/SmtB family transcription factor [Gemmatimonadaceae bacterium]|nr:metalloregulator ArsR/SmtB family transcription factor [Gemmatimonadaceae bacterium]
MERLNLAFGALADPTRRAILSGLASGEASVSDLARPFKMSLPAVSKHLKVLQRAGLVTQGREAQWRPCRLEAAPLKEVADWVERYRVYWEQSFDSLEDYLLNVQSKEKKRGRKK